MMAVGGEHPQTGAFGARIQREEDVRRAGKAHQGLLVADNQRPVRAVAIQ